jgi:hypothetical protein
MPFCIWCGANHLGVDCPNRNAPEGAQYILGERSQPTLTFNLLVRTEVLATIDNQIKECLAYHKSQTDKGFCSGASLARAAELSKLRRKFEK